MFQSRQKLMELIEEYHVAVKNNDINKVEEILDRDGVPNNLIDSEYFNVAPILFAVQEKFWDLALKLFEREADLEVKTEPFNWYLLHECTVNAPDKLFRNVVQYADFTVTNRDGKTALMVAIEKEKYDRVEYMLENKKASLVAKDKNKRTALHYAAINGNHNLFLDLVKKGANIFEEDKDKKNPMDLLKDEIFRNNLPHLLENIKIELDKPKLRKDEILSVEEQLTSETKSNDEEIKKPKISSLGKLVKKK